jgi:Na+/pantothenate symporter
MASASWFLVAPKFVPLTRTYGSLTVADFLGSHYNSLHVRQVAAGIVAVSSVLYLIAIYRGASLALENFLDIPYTGCLLTVMVIVTLYTLLGGFESVVLTDALQGVLMLVGAVAMAVAMLHAGGGISTIFQTLKSQDPKLVSFFDGQGLSLAMAYSLSVGVKYLVEPRQLSRFYGLKNASALRIASIVAPLAIFVTYFCLLPMGAMARTIIPLDEISATETDRIVPHLLGQANLLGPVASTLFLVVLLSAAMSSIDSVLLVAASTIDRDLLPAAAMADHRATRAVQRIRVWVVVVSATAAVSALLPFTRDIVQMTAFSGSLYGACFLPTLVVGLYMRQRAAVAAIISMMVGATSVVVAFALKKMEVTAVHEVYPGILMGMATFVICNYVTRIQKD